MSDTFTVPASCVPEGRHYRWVRLMGAAHIKELRAKGWSPTLAKETNGLTERTGRAWVRHRGMTLMQTSRIPVVEQMIRQFNEEREQKRK